MSEFHFIEAYEKLSTEDKFQFKKISIRLLNITYLNRVKKDNKTWDEDYLFIESNFELFQTYFDFSGYELTLHSEISVISLTNSFEFAKKILDKESTLYILALRQIFDEKVKEFSHVNTVSIRMADFLDKLFEYGIRNKKLNRQLVYKKLAELAKFGIIAKQKGKWEEMDTLFIIYPVIKLVLPIEKIEAKLKIIEKEADYD